MAQLLPIRPDPMIPMWAEDEDAMSDLQDWSNLNLNLDKDARKAFGYEATPNEEAMSDPEDSCQLNFWITSRWYMSYPLFSTRNLPGYSGPTNFQYCIPLHGGVRRRSVSGECPCLAGYYVAWCTNRVTCRPLLQYICCHIHCHICFWFGFGFYQRSA